jgi:peroxiredoxin
VTGVRDLRPGQAFPDLSLPDHDGHVRRLSELAGGDPLLLHTYRGWWCPKERTWFRHLVALQDDAEVAYTRFASLSIDPPPVSAAFRAGLDARWPFLSDPDRAALTALGLRETTDTVHAPYLPTVWLLGPDLAVHRWWLGYWFWARPTPAELHAELRELSAGLRPDWDPPRPDREG